MQTAMLQLLEAIENQEKRYIQLAKTNKKLKSGVDAILTSTTFLKMKAKELMENEKTEMSRAFEQGKQAQWEADNMKKGMQPHNIPFDEYYSERYYQAVP